MSKIQEKFDLTGRVAIVTGGGGLLGYEFCKTLVEAGASVVTADLNMDHAVRAASRLIEAGYNTFPFQLDITSKESTLDLVAETTKRYGRVDILVNCAALDPKFDPDAAAKGIAPGAFEDYPLEQWNDALNVNLTGIFLITQACVKQMIAQGKKGSIINICSTYGLNGPDQRIYIKDGKRVAYKPVYYTTTNTLLQVLVPARLRGRVMSLYILTSWGLIPVGNLLAGVVAERLSATAALVGGGVVTLTAVVVVTLAVPELRRVAAGAAQDPAPSR